MHTDLLYMYMYTVQMFGCTMDVLYPEALIRPAMERAGVEYGEVRL